MQPDIDAFRLEAQFIVHATAATKAGIRRVWQQGKPVYESVGDRTYAWWPDGRLVPQDFPGATRFMDPTLVYGPNFEASGPSRAP